MFECDILIAGAGITGLSVAREITNRHPSLKVIILEKEDELASHASGRNSGVIHAGFYYTPDSLKARLTAEGNRLLTQYCLDNGLSIRRCGKVVIAKNENELETLYDLKRRGDRNGVSLDIVDAKELLEIEPNAKTYRKALYSPSTSSIEPKQVINEIADKLSSKKNVDILLKTRFLKKEKQNKVRSSAGSICYKYFVNCAGLYADRIARDFGVGRKYIFIPFKGLYLKYLDNNLIQKHIYPVPDIENPFLGIHFTKAADGTVKVGPTAIPAFWRENYEGFSRFNVRELLETLSLEARLLVLNSFNFRQMALREIQKYSLKNFSAQASSLVKEISQNKFGGYLPPGIRAQLIDLEKMTLEMDFVIEKSENSVHILNAVSPAFTCAFSFSKFAVDIIDTELRNLK